METVQTTPNLLLKNWGTWVKAGSPASSPHGLAPHVFEKGAPSPIFQNQFSQKSCEGCVQGPWGAEHGAVPGTPPQPSSESPTPAFPCPPPAFLCAPPSRPFPAPTPPFPWPPAAAPAPGPRGPPPPPPGTVFCSPPFPKVRNVQTSASSNATEKRPEQD